MLWETLLGLLVIAPIVISVIGLIEHNLSEKRSAHSQRQSRHPKRMRHRLNRPRNRTRAMGPLQDHRSQLEKILAGVLLKTKVCQFPKAEALFGLEESVPHSYS